MIQKDVCATLHLYTANPIITIITYLLGSSSFHLLLLLLLLSIHKQYNIYGGLYAKLNAKRKTKQA